MLSNKVVKNIGNYLIAKLATSGISFISIPIFTYLLTPSDYGILNVFASYVSIGAVVLTLNTQVGVGRYYFEENNDFGRLLFMSIVFPIALLTFFFFLFAWQKSTIAEWLELPEKTINFIVPSVFMTVTGGYILQIYRAKEEAVVVRKYNIAKAYTSFIIAAVWVYLLTVDRYMGRLWANIVVMVIFSFWTFKKIWPLIQFQLKKEHLNYLLTYSVPLIPAYLSSVILAQFDRIMINSSIGNEEAGLYSFAYNIGSLQVMVANAIQYAWNPSFYRYMNAKNYEQHDKDVLNVNRLIAFCSCGLILFADLLGKILGAKSYHTALYLIPIIVAGQFFISFLNFYKNHISYAKKTWLSSFVFIGGATLNAVLNYIYIPMYGSFAGAFTTLISYVFQAVLMFGVVKYILKSHFVNPIRMMDAIGVLFICVLAYYGIAYLSINLFLEILLKTFVLAISMLVLFRGQLDWVKAYISNKRN